jgi:hypothetical protein
MRVFRAFETGRGSSSGFRETSPLIPPEHRLVHKGLSHTVAIAANVQAGHEPLPFERLAA